MSRFVVLAFLLLQSQETKAHIQKTEDMVQARCQCGAGYEEKLDDIAGKILIIAKSRPVVLLSLQVSIEGREPDMGEIEDLADRISELKRAEAQISEVQIYSATRPKWNNNAGHLKLKTLSQTAQMVHRKSGVKAQVQ
jgi:hypothetical protein